jgi:N-acetylneuraminate synthase
VSRIVEIAGRPIGEGHPTYVIAELSGNHRQDLEEAIRLVRAAKWAGADAVKLQTYTADTLTIDCANEHFRIRGTAWDGRTLYDLYREACTPWEWHPKLKEVADELGIALFSTPFDASAVDFLEKMGMPAYKIASFELVDLALVRLVAATGRPLVLSTGMATLAEIEEAVGAARKAGATEIALLKCTSAYPALPEEMNLRTLPHLAQAFGVPAGLSDHTLGVAVPVAAVALGASIVEKHLTLSRSVPGPDTAFSLEPEELKAMVEAVRTTERALGGVRYEPTAKELESQVFRRSLFAVEDVRRGEVLTERNVRSIRPGHGLAPRYLQVVLGRRASRDLPRGTPLTWDAIQ